MRLDPLMLAPAGIVLALGACATVPAADPPKSQR